MPNVELPEQVRDAVYWLNASGRSLVADALAQWAEDKIANYQIMHTDQMNTEAELNDLLGMVQYALDGPADSWRKILTDALRMHNPEHQRPAPSPLGGLADVLAEYDRIVNARLDPRDAEADFVMRGSDWRVIREALPSERRESIGEIEQMKAALRWLSHTYASQAHLGTDYEHAIEKVLRGE